MAIVFFITLQSCVAHACLATSFVSIASADLGTVFLMSIFPPWPSESARDGWSASNHELLNLYLASSANSFISCFAKSTLACEACIAGLETNGGAPSANNGCCPHVDPQCRLAFPPCEWQPPRKCAVTGTGTCIDVLAGLPLWWMAAPWF